MIQFDFQSADILIVDDTPADLRILIETLSDRGHRVRPVLDGKSALEVALREPPMLILLDINMPGMSGYDVCREFKRDPRLADIPIIFLSASASVEDEVRAFAVGGADYVTKPFRADEVNARVGAHLKIRQLMVELDRHNRNLEEMVRIQVREISESQIATIVAMAKLSEYRDDDTGSHILRVQGYCRTLARRLAAEGAFASTIDAAFIGNIFQASALHDIGKIGIPDSILLKPGQLTVAEVAIMKTHSMLGARTLAEVMKAYPGNAFVRMGMDVARSHHERWDGSGYPDGLAGEAIPLSARIVALADLYDALRSKRPYKPAFDAEKTYAIITEGDGRTSPSHLDPRVLAAFKASAVEFEATFRELQEPVSGLL